jgi:hypothetical protein
MSLMLCRVQSQVSIALGTLAGSNVLTYEFNGRIGFIFGGNGVALLGRDQR